MNIKRTIILAVAFAFIQSIHAQVEHFIGLHKNEIKTKMQTEMDKFNLDETSVNKTFNYLKYVDYLAQQTILFFLDENDACTASKWICDYVLLDEKINELNSEYNETDENIWQYTHDHQVYEVKLEKEDWFFSIITRPKK